MKKVMFIFGSILLIALLYLYLKMVYGFIVVRVHDEGADHYSVRVDTGDTSYGPILLMGDRAIFLSKGDGVVTIYCEGSKLPLVYISRTNNGTIEVWMKQCRHIRTDKSLG